MPASPSAAVPLTVITGLDAAAKARVAQALLACTGGDWVLLDNDGGAAAALAEGYPAARSGGCACCSGQVMLHAALVQLLRQHRPRQLLLVAAAAAEPLALRRALAQGEAMRAWTVARTLCVRDAAAAAAAPEQARGVWQSQCDAADAVIQCDAATPVETLRAQLRAVWMSGAAPGPNASSRQIES
jgi:G3E family GTPase